MANYGLLNAPASTATKPVDFTAIKMKPTIKDATLSALASTKKAANSAVAAATPGGVSMGARSIFPGQNATTPAPTLPAQQTFVPPAQVESKFAPISNSPEMKFTAASSPAPIAASNTPPATQLAVAQPTKPYQAALISQIVSASQMSPEEKELRSRVGETQDKLALAQGQNDVRSIPLEFKTGRANTLANLASQRTTALNSQIQSETAAREAALKGLTSAAGLMSPMQVSPGTAVYSPTGEPIIGMGAAADNYAQWQNQKAAIDTNAGLGSEYQKQAADLSKTLSQIDSLSPRLVQFLTENKLNEQGLPLYNQPIGVFMSQANPAARTSANAMLAELKTYTAQVLGSSGLNPTEVSDTVNSFDFSQLSPSQMQVFVENLRAMAQSRLQPIQQTSAASYGANYNGAQPYMGNPADTSIPSVNTAMNPNAPTNPLAQAAVGIGIQSGDSILNFLKSVTGGIGGAMIQGGLAKRVLGL